VCDGIRAPAPHQVFGLALRDVICEVYGPGGVEGQGRKRDFGLGAAVRPRRRGPTEFRGASSPEDFRLDPDPRSFEANGLADDPSKSIALHQPEDPPRSVAELL
jgi:hypothetical protein